MQTQRDISPQSPYHRFEFCVAASKHLQLDILLFLQDTSPIEFVLLSIKEDIASLKMEVAGF
jgi:hypothetical protein